MDGEDSRSDATYNHKGSMTDGDLATVARKDIKPVDSNDSDAYVSSEVYQCGADEEGESEETDEKGNQQPPLRSGAHNSHILLWALTENATRQIHSFIPSLSV